MTDTPERTEAEIGRAECASCGRPIEYVAQRGYWIHSGGFKPRHIANPKPIPTPSDAEAGREDIVTEMRTLLAAVEDDASNVVGPSPDALRRWIAALTSPTPPPADAVEALRKDLREALEEERDSRSEIKDPNCYGAGWSDGTIEAFEFVLSRLDQQGEGGES